MTPRGVAAFAGATLRRLCSVQALLAFVAGASVSWFLYYACLPPLQKAIDQLPDEGYILQQTLFTPLTNTVTLVAEPLLGVRVNLPRHDAPPLPSDLQIVFYQDEVHVTTRLGALVFRYPKGWMIEFNRKELAPALQAWTPALLVLACLATVAFLFLAWFVLASVLFFVPIVVARYSDRALTIGGSWKLTCAALLPGTLFLSASFCAFGLGWIQLLHLTFLAAVHLMIGWLYLVLSPLALPRPVEMTQEENPFRPPPPPAAADSPPEPVRKSNPFATPGSPAENTPPVGASDPWEP